MKESDKSNRASVKDIHFFFAEGVVSFRLLNDWAYAQKTNGNIWLHWRGRTYFIAPQVGQEKNVRSGSRLQQVDEIFAPMPGRVIDIKISVGQQVSRGQVAIILEAMKMEYVLKTEGAGIVQSIFCKIGSPVGVGEKLVMLGVAKD